MEKKKMLILVMGSLLIVIFIIVLIWFIWFRTEEVEQLYATGIPYSGNMDPSEADLPGGQMTKEETDEIKKASRDDTVEISVSGEETGDNISQNQSSQKAYEEYVVICSVNTEEEAKKIAEQVDGILVKYEYGIGTIEIKETVAQLMERLDRMGGDKPEVYPNYIYSINQENN